MGAQDNRGFEVDHQTNNNTKSREKAGSLNVEADEASVKKEVYRIYRNVFLISISFLLLFVAFESISKLQSSINKDGNLGTWSNVTVYTSLVLSCMVLPSILINKLKVKWTLVVCVFTYSTYMAAQFYPQFYTLLPTGFLLGLGAAPLWSAKCTYLTQLANRLGELKNVESEQIVVKFFGIFFFFFQCNAILGNIIASAVLSSGQEEAVEDPLAMLRCGANYSTAYEALPTSPLVQEEEQEENENFAISNTTRYTLAGIYLACSLLAAAVIAIFVDPLSRYGEDERSNEGMSGKQLLLATSRHMMKKKQLLLIPLTMWSGIEQGFFNADFTAGLSTCAFGVSVTSQVLICFGVCNALASVSSGFIIKFTGRIPIFIFGALINIAVIIVIFSWTPVPGSVAVVFVLGALWGVGDAIWQTQINALYGVLFSSEEEAAFSNYRLWESLGFIIAFITQSLGVPLFHKMIMVLVFLIVGMTGYLIVEVIDRREKREITNRI